jgi:hypothetical protein
LAAKLSEMITRFRGCSLKIQHQSSFELNGLKNGTRKYFENSLKSMQIFQILMGGMNFRKRSQKKQNIFSSEECATTPNQFFYLPPCLLSKLFHLARRCHPKILLKEQVLLAKSGNPPTVYRQFIDIAD